MAKISLYAGAPQTKAELRQMLTEAVRGTRPGAENGRSARRRKMIAARAAPTSNRFSQAIRYSPPDFRASTANSF